MPVSSQTAHRYYPVYTVTLAWCACMIAAACLIDTPAAVLSGLREICATQGILITDYVAVGGFGAAVANCALVTAASVAVLWLTRAPLGGSTCSTLGLMAGFALFGKDILNIWPIIIGSLLYALARREPMGKHAAVGLMASCLSPIVSFFWFSLPPWPGYLVGTLAGLVIGFCLPVMAAYTTHLLRGLNLYNVGFACGLTALLFVPIMTAAGHTPVPVLIWSTGHNAAFSALLFPLYAACILAGVLLLGGIRPAWRAYRGLLRASGWPSDFLTGCGGGAVLINMGLDGLLITGYILLIGGELNGPTVGSILTVVGFSANGKHLRSISYILTGVVLAGLLLPGFSLTDPLIQFSALFATTLCPLAGAYGFSAGVLAGFFHICLVQRTGAPVCGLNLYNNGFTGGLVAVILYPFLAAVFPDRHCWSPPETKE